MQKTKIQIFGDDFDVYCFGPLRPFRPFLHKAFDERAAKHGPPGTFPVRSWKMILGSASWTKSRRKSNSIAGFLIRTWVTCTFAQILRKKNCPERGEIDMIDLDDNGWPPPSKGKAHDGWRVKMKLNGFRTISTSCKPIDERPKCWPSWDDIKKPKRLGRRFGKNPRRSFKRTLAFCNLLSVNVGDRVGKFDSWISDSWVPGRQDWQDDDRSSAGIR